MKRISSPKAYFEDMYKDVPSRKPSSIRFETRLLPFLAIVALTLFVAGVTVWVVALSLVGAR